MSPVDLAQGLVIHVPAMKKGFVIDTVRGKFVVEPGPMANLITDLFERHFRLELMRVEAANHLARRKAQGAAV
jgi:hypothetical protein